VAVALPAGAPVVDEGGFPATPAAGGEGKGFATQASNLSLTAVIVFAEGDQGVPGDDSDDQGQRQSQGGDNGKPVGEHGSDGRTTARTPPPSRAPPRARLGLWLTMTI